MIVDGGVFYDVLGGYCMDNWISYSSDVRLNILDAKVDRLFLKDVWK
jgi:hypothetical protein